LATYSFTLEPLPPFRLDLTVWILRRRPDNQIDHWDGQAYHRILVLDDEPIGMSVTQIGTSQAPQLEISLNGAGVKSSMEAQVTNSLERLLGIQVDLTEFYRFSETSVHLKMLADPFRGAKPPRFPTLFETMLNAIACQQLSLNVGIQLLNRLSQTYGLAFPMESGTFHAFPRPEDLVDADLEELRHLGFSYRKGEYLHGLARSIVDQQVNLEEIETLPDQQAVAELCRIKGVGRWTAEYFLLRGLGRTHIFPGDDVGARNNLQDWLDLPERLDYSGVHQAIYGWEGYGGLIYFHLLLKSLLEKGFVSNEKRA
jgi:DNA-3-methyladenine glycosylase II